MQSHNRRFYLLKLNVVMHLNSLLREYGTGIVSKTSAILALCAHLHISVYYAAALALNF